MTTIKKTFIKNLEKYTWYFRLRYSKLFLSFVLFKNKALKQALQEETELFHQVLKPFSPPFLIFDIGANEGYSADIFLKLGANKVICLEPDSRSYKALKARFRHQSKVQIVPKAVSHQVGEADFFQVQTGSALNTLNKKWKHILEHPTQNRWNQSFVFQHKTSVSTTTLDALILQFGLPQFIKIDTEGHEQAVIEGLNQAVPLLCFEANLPEFRTETIRCLEHLFSIKKNTTFNYAIGNSLIFNQYQSFEKFKAFMEQTSIRYMEVFCKMQQ